MTIVAFDHAAIPIEDVDAMPSFYRSLGFEVRDQKPPLFWSVHFGDQKLHFHGPEIWRAPSFTLRGPAARPGCGDFCFVWEGSLDALTERLRREEIAIEEGPVTRVGGRGAGHAEGTSVYVRDPDGNLLELIVYGE